MSSIDHSVTNAAVIPRIESGIFVDHEGAQFAAGLIAVGDVVVPGRSSEVGGYHLLRGNVYVDQTRMISAEALREDGTEYDIDDPRSVHFAVIENAGDAQRVVGSIRLIVKETPDPRPLPIEDFFPEAFEDDPAPVLSTEVSRYICRHEDAAVQGTLKKPLFTAALSYIMTHGLGPTYAVVEDKVKSSLLMEGVPLQQIAPARFVPEYADNNLAVRIDTAELARRLGLQQQSLDALRGISEGMTYYRTAQRSGHLALTAAA